MACIAFLVEEMFEDSELRVPYDHVRSRGHDATRVGLASGKGLKGYHGKETITTAQAAAEVRADGLGAEVFDKKKAA